MPNALDECFAYRATLMKNGSWKERCEALNEMECKKKDGVCPFFKRQTQEVAELRRYNNCTDVEQAISEYARKQDRKRNENTN